MLLFDDVLVALMELLELDVLAAVLVLELDDDERLEAELLLDVELVEEVLLTEDGLDELEVELDDELEVELELDVIRLVLLLWLEPELDDEEEELALEDELELENMSLNQSHPGVPYRSWESSITSGSVGTSPKLDGNVALAGSTP